MNRDKAAELLSNGYTLIHKYFCSGESISLVGDKIITEDGYNFTEQFWKLDQFKDGWEVV